MHILIYRLSMTKLQCIRERSVFVLYDLEPFNHIIKFIFITMYKKYCIQACIYLSN